MSIYTLKVCEMSAISSKFDEVETLQILMNVRL